MIELYDHQKVALAHLRLNPHFALYMEQGTGKTMCILTRLAELFASSEITNALIVCPKAVIGSWYRDMEKLELDLPVTVVNYESVWRKPEYNKKWDAIVCDESHKIKSHTTKQGSFLTNLAVRAKYRWILTGTPITNGKMEDIFNQYTFLEPIDTGRVKDKKTGAHHIYSSIFDGSYYKFLDEYAYLNVYHKPYRYRNIERLQDIISAHSYRVTKAECLDLPEKLPDVILDVDNSSAKIYKEMMEHSTVSMFDVLAENPRTKMLRLRQIASGFITTDAGVKELKCDKINVLADYLDGFERKFVVFCEFRHSIDVVDDWMDTVGINHVILDGRQADKEVWRRFQTDKNIQCIICQYQSGNAGIDLYAADTVIYFEPTLSSNLLEQSRDRVHRIGQHNPCNYYHLVTTGTIERVIYSTLKRYEDFDEKVFVEYMSEWQRSGR